MVQNAINAKNCFVQQVASKTQTLVSCTGAIPGDDSIPQNTEGTEVITVSITPKYSTSILIINFTASYNKASGVAGFCSCGLFQDTTANALAAMCHQRASAQGHAFIMQHYMTSGTTSSTTFKIRCGANSGNMYLNGSTAGAQYFNGRGAITLTVTEYLS